MTALASRLLAEADSLHNAMRYVRDERTFAMLQAVENGIREAAAALSGRVPEGDMARALEWVRAERSFYENPEAVKHLPAIEEAIAAYDPNAGGRTALSGREAVAWTHDAENWGNALNDAGWEFLEHCPEKSALLFNSAKPALRMAILKYAASVAAAPSAKGVAP